MSGSGDSIGDVKETPLQTNGLKVYLIIQRIVKAVVLQQIRIGQIIRGKNTSSIRMGNPWSAEIAADSNRSYNKREKHWLDQKWKNIGSTRSTEGKWHKATGKRNTRLTEKRTHQINYFTINPLLTTSTPQYRESPVNRHGCVGITRPGQGVPSTSGTLTRPRFPAVYISSYRVYRASIQCFHAQKVISGVHALSTLAVVAAQ